MAAKDSKTIDELDEYFSFKVGEMTYILPIKTKALMTPGWVRKNRGRDQVDYVMTLLEQLTGQDPVVALQFDLTTDDVKTGKEILKALDDLEWPEYKRIQDELGAHLGVQMGE